MDRNNLDELMDRLSDTPQVSEHVHDIGVRVNDDTVEILFDLGGHYAYVWMDAEKADSLSNDLQRLARMAGYTERS